VVRLQWPHVLWDRGVICVEFGKTERARRYVPLGDRVLEMFRARQQTVAPQFWEELRLSSRNYLWVRAPEYRAPQIVRPQ